jgi:hypothetical protein
VTLAAYGSTDPRAGALRADLATATVRRLHRTSDLSGALLRHAAAGRSLPQVVDVLDALGGRGDLTAVTDRLVAVGASSGTALAHGVVAATRALDSQDRAAGPSTEVA